MRLTLCYIKIVRRELSDVIKCIKSLYALVYLFNWFVGVNRKLLNIAPELQDTLLNCIIHATSAISSVKMAGKVGDIKRINTQYTYTQLTNTSVYLRLWY